MNRSKQLKKVMTALSLSLLLNVALSPNTFAQSENVRESQSVSISDTEDGKVKLKVIIKKGNDETTFEKTYDSREEMQNDPELEKYGINIDSFGFGRNGGSPKFFFHNGPGQGFWNQGNMDVDSLRSSIRGMMKGFGPGAFSFSFDDDSFMDMDSLIQRFNFKNDNGRFFFNGEELNDMDSLRAALKNKFGNMMFDFDFGDWDDDTFSTFRFGNDEDDVKVISRVNVFIRSAKDEDKEAAGTDDMDGLELRDINFYPNPSDGRFDVELETGSDATIQVSIIDPDGNEVYNRQGSPRDGRYDFRVDLSKEQKGIYIMKVVQNNKALTKRVIIE